jgi:hypothetical protein
MSQTSSGAIHAVINPPSGKSQRTPPPPTNPEVFEILEFCSWARISRTMAFREIAAGRLVVRRIGDKSLVPIENARAWLASLPTNREA